MGPLGKFQCIATTESPTSCDRPQFGLFLHVPPPSTTRTTPFCTTVAMLCALLRGQETGILLFRARGSRSDLCTSKPRWCNYRDLYIPCSPGHIVNNTMKLCFCPSHSCLWPASRLVSARTCLAAHLRVQTSRQTINPNSSDLQETAAQCLCARVCTSISFPTLLFYVEKFGARQGHSCLVLAPKYAENKLTRPGMLIREAFK